MEDFYFIGVDVSKKKLDFCVMFEGKVVCEEKTANHQSAIMSLICKRLSKYIFYSSFSLLTFATKK